MTQSDKEQAEQRVREEALSIARSTQSPGQTKEQTKLIAKGIEKGIAFYKQQQKAKSRERDKARKKALKQRVPEKESQEIDGMFPDYEIEPSRTRPPLLIAGAIFSLAALLHFIRYFLGWRIMLENFTFPLSWSLALGLLAAGLAFWMFRAARD